MTTSVSSAHATEKSPPPAEVLTHSANNLTKGLALKVIKRNGELASFTPEKISVALTKAFLAVEGSHAAGSSRIHDTVASLTESVTESFLRRRPQGGNIHIEDIQDMVELALMRTGNREVVVAYVLYREERAKLRKQKKDDKLPVLHMLMDDGTTQVIDKLALAQQLQKLAEGIENINIQAVVNDAYRNLFDGVPAAEVDNALTLSARAMVENEINYTFLSARLLNQRLKQEAAKYLGLDTPLTKVAELYQAALPAFIAKGIENEIIDPAMADYDLQKLAAAIQPERDELFTYLGIQTLYDRYFIHRDGTRYELPQVFFMRVAMGLASQEPQDREDKAIAFYNMLSQMDFMSSTPTLFNSATTRPQLSSCYLTTVPDDLRGIYDAIRDNAMLSKYAGGLGNDWTPVRGMGAHIKGTNGKSSGVVPFLNVADATAVAVNQGGKRKGAVCAYLETWHMDIEEFLELRKNTGDERRRTHDMNTANWIPDLFMKRVFQKGQWTLFSPNDVPDLHDKYGTEFEQTYTAYEQQVAEGQLRGKTVDAVTLWRKMLGMVFETGHPWMTYKDPCNLRSPQQHVGVVHSSNLCTEITLNTSADEIAVCNLGSINLTKHLDMQNKCLDMDKLSATIKTAIRMLDNVIDYNYYSVPQAKNSNAKHRPIGMGLMGFQDALQMLRIPYASEEAVEFADKTMEQISYLAIQASSDLAVERGTYQSYEGSLWSQGILPIDSIKLLQEARGDEHLEQDTTARLDWDALRAKVKAQGMRNSNTMAIAPTATIANICGVTQSIEPTYQNLYVKSNLSGEFTVVNPHLARELKDLNLWDEVMVNDLKYYNGSLQQIERIPEELRALYATAFEIPPKWLLAAGSRRQKWLDQAQSLNLYMAEPSGKKLDKLYRKAWLLGLKTTYYLRTLGATSTEKSTITDAALNAVSVNSSPKACSIDDPDCEACQ